jgi:effector-binding domain-containing protein
MSYDIEVIELDPQAAMAIEAEVAPQDLGAELARILPTVHGHVTARGGQPAGMPFLRYLDMGATTFRIQAGLPVVEPIEGDDEIESIELPGGKTATTLFLGPYHEVGEAWDALNAWCAEQGIEVHFGGWDVYENDPSTVSDPSELRTRIYQPLT